jgi:hypothetical protein
VHWKKSIILLILLVCAVGAVTAFRYFRFMEEDIAYCSVCHIMEEGYNTWEKSGHYLIICQECHMLNYYEGNKLLMARFIRGEHVPQEHGRVKPWEVCIKCHMQDTAQGSVTLRESYGHARHVFMQNVPCTSCHKGAGHEFGVDHIKCQNCHTDKMVHGMGTAGIYCLNCHTFTERSTKLVSKERCFNCHNDMPSAGIMSQIKCFECHHPHTKLTFKSEDCLASCHGNETRVGMHGLHLTKTSMGCLDCHKAHTWSVGMKEARGLCDKCHPIKDPMTFVY